MQSAREQALPGRAMSELKSGTADLHRQLEQRLARAEHFSRRDRYIDYLSRLAAFHGGVEDSWAGVLQPLLPDFQMRRKLGLLRRDLDYLGSEAPGSVPVPAVDDGAAALGAFYVVEGATLGGQVLLPLVARTLGVDAEHGASYLASYGPAVREMWARFG